MNTHAQTPGVVVLGMHRSGTSLVADLVRRWGAWLGEPDALIPADQANPRGYWELAALVDLNRRLLREVGSGGWLPPSPAGEAALARMSLVSPWRDEALRLLGAFRASGKPWCWKDPRLALLLPFWAPLWPTGTVYLLPFRAPLAAARSLSTRDGRSVTDALLLWCCYVASTLRHVPAEAPQLFMSYESVLNDSVAQCRRLDTFLGTHLDSGDGRAGSHRAAAMQAAIDPASRHFDGGEAMPDSELGRSCHQLYDILRSRSERSGKPISREEWNIPADWRPALMSH